MEQTLDAELYLVLTEIKSPKIPNRGLGNLESLHFYSVPCKSSIPIFDDWPHLLTPAWEVRQER